MSDTTHFGFRNVPLADKQRRVDEVFHKVARRYDLMNDLMSGGLHRAWKDALITALGPTKSARTYELLDVAGGTGDIAFRAVAAGGPNVRAIVADINGDMLAVGRESANHGQPLCLSRSAERKNDHGHQDCCGLNDGSCRQASARF